eukprot:GEMP01009283.1.p1 GENE.GEMP01009283.1~~GEMP01009283.1.p1  ORF type:complete len:968 (+),score=233.49 GEMP01009283.1:149-3052(+)
MELHDAYASLRVHQLRQMCASHEVKSTGRKDQLVERLVECDSSVDPAKIRAMALRSLKIRPAHLHKTPPAAKERKKEVRKAAPAIADEELWELLWCISDGELKCPSCNTRLSQRSGRFGLFFPCANRECAEKMTLRQALKALDRDPRPIVQIERIGEDLCVVQCVGISPSLVFAWVSLCTQSITKNGEYEAAFPYTEYDVVLAALSAQCDGLGDLGSNRVPRIFGIPPHLRSYLDEHHASTLHSPAVDMLHSATLACPAFEQLRPFQRECVLRTLSMPRMRLLLADEMGLGKTVQVLAVIAALRAFPLLIICPAACRLVWIEEIERWCANILSPRDVHVIFSTNTMLPQRDTASSTPKVVICSYSMLQQLELDMVGRQWACVVLDEAHKLKADGINHIVGELISGVEKVIMMTGTPYCSRVGDVYSLVSLLCPGMLGNSKREFLAHYEQKSCASQNGDRLVDGKCRRPRELSYVLHATCMVRRKKSEVLTELPPKIIRWVPLLLDAELPEPPVTDAEYAGLLKATSGLRWMRDLCDKVCKVVFFAHHISVMDYLEQNLCTPLIRIDGTRPVNTRHRLLRTFAETAKMSAILGITAAGVGIDLSCAQVCVFVEAPPDLAWLRQAQDRLHRHGQTGTVELFFLTIAPCEVPKLKRFALSDSNKWFKFRRQEHDAWRVTKPKIIDVDEPQASSQEVPAPVEYFPKAAFEVSLTQRVHMVDAVTLQPLGLTWAPGEDSELSWQKEAKKFYERWSELPAYQRRDLPPMQEHELCAQPRRPAAKPCYTRCVSSPIVRSPEGALCKVKYRGGTIEYWQKSQNGLFLCLECNAPIRERPAEAESDLFDTGKCRAAWFVKRSSASIRRQLFDLEHGVCQKCKLDTYTLFLDIRHRTREEQLPILRSRCPLLAAIPSVTSRLDCLTEGMFWEADHVVPVWMGGGQCGLENMQTLCVICHREKTKEEGAKRRKVIDIE